MDRYKKKPIIIEATQWDGTYQDLERIKVEFPGIIDSARYHPTNNIVYHWRIITLGGGRDVSPNDFIIRGVTGEFYPCKPDLFEQSYEKV
jgi:hypothetical protein